MRFILYIKSHCEVPDYEDECEAESFDEAAQLFYSNMSLEGKADWSPEDLKDHIGLLGT